MKTSTEFQAADALIQSLEDRADTLESKMDFVAELSSQAGKTLEGIAAFIADQAKRNAIQDYLNERTAMVLNKLTTQR